LKQIILIQFVIMAHQLPDEIFHHIIGYAKTPFIKEGIFKINSMKLILFNKQDNHITYKLFKEKEMIGKQNISFDSFNLYFPNNKNKDSLIGKYHVSQLKSFT